MLLVVKIIEIDGVMGGRNVVVTQHYHSRNLTNTLSIPLKTLVSYETSKNAAWLWLLPKTQNAPNSLLVADY